MYESLDEVMKPADVPPTLYVCKSWLVLRMLQYFGLKQTTWEFGFTRVFLAVVSIPAQPQRGSISVSRTGKEGSGRYSTHS